MTGPASVRRAVGRPRHHDDDSEREAILTAAYRQMSVEGADMTIQAILEAAGLSTRSFYRHFSSKDSLLLAMYLRDAEYAASRLRSRVDGAGSPVAAVGAWIDEIFGFRRSRARSARVEALRTVHGAGAEGADEVAARARALLCEPLVDAISAGVAEGDFCADIDAARAADHIAVLVLDAAGVTSPDAPRRERQESTTVFCLRALGTSAADLHGIVP